MCLPLLSPLHNQRLSKEELSHQRYPDTVVELLQREFEWRRHKSGHLLNHNDELAWLAIEIDSRRDDGHALLTALAMCSGLDYQYVEAALEFFECCLFSSWMEGRTPWEKHQSTLCCAMACLNLAKERKCSVRIQIQETCNRDQPEFDSDLLGTLNIKWSQVSSVQDQLLTAFPGVLYGPVTMTDFVYAFVSLFPEHIQSHLMKASLLQVKMCTSDSTLALFPKSTLAVSAVQIAVLQYRKEFDLGQFSHEDVDTTIQQIFALVSCHELINEATFLLLQLHDEDLFLGSFAPGNDDTSFVSLPDSLKNNKLIANSGPHRYPETITITSMDIIEDEAMDKSY